MNKQLIDYVRVYRSAISAADQHEVLRQLASVEWEQHNFYSDEGLVNHGTEPFEFHGSIDSTPVLQKIIWESLRKYILEDINFPWFSGWHGFSNIKFIKYDEDSEMVNHCDHIQHGAAGIPILSVIGVLNNDYQGGEFVLFDDHTVELTAGDVIIFPSVFLYPHRVNKIIKGSRYSFVAWCS